jgi:hypothetical protein
MASLLKKQGFDAKKLSIRDFARPANSSIHYTNSRNGCQFFAELPAQLIFSIPTMREICWPNPPWAGFGAWVVLSRQFEIIELIPGKPAQAEGEAWLTDLDPENQYEAR